MRSIVLPNLLYFGLPILGAIIALPLAYFVVRRDQRNVNNRLFCMVLVSISLVGLLTFAMRISPDTTKALFWHKLIFIAGSAIFVFYYHFTSSYVKTLNRKIVFAAYIYLVVIVTLALMGMVTTGITKESYGYAPRFGLSIYFISVAGSVFLILSLRNLIKAQRHSTKWVEKTRLNYMIIAIIILLIFGLLDFWPNLPPIGILGNLLFGILTAIAILRYQMLDIHIIVRKSVAYLLISTIVAIPYVGVIILFNLYFQENMSIWGHFVLLLSLALVLQAVWQRVQILVDRWFYRERYDFLQELERFSQEAHSISNLGELGSSLVGLISRAFQTANIHLLLMNEVENLRTVSFTGTNAKQVSFYRRSLLIDWLRRNKGILQRQQLDLDPQLQSLTAREKADIDEVNAELIIPLKTNTGELVGLLLMGPKRSEQPYSDDDLRWIITVTSRMAVELENARLYAQETAVRQELQRQNEQKTEFLHHVAHELKTPLTAVISSSELMTADNIVSIPFEQRERLLNNINRSAWLMDKKVSELLDLARIQIGRVEMKIEPVNLREVVDDLTSQLSSLFKNKEQSVETQIPDTIPRVRADRERTTEVVLNLLSNANKFSPTGGHITIIASERDNLVQVEVRDSAPLINEEDRARIFDPYYRGGTTEDQQRVSGLGLGLAISKSLVMLQQGEIGVTSEEGRGNIFYFTLPVWKDEEKER